jgi:hypothetical protein
MMKKSTSTKVSLFVTFVLVSAIFSVNGNVYAQNETLPDALNVTEVPLANSTNVTQTTDVPVEEELLPTTTTEGIAANNSTGNATGSTENVTETVPVEEELLPTNTTTDGLVTINATSAAPRDEITGEEATTTTSPHGHSENATSDKSTVSRDSQTILLEGQSLPEGSFIHLYDSTPYKIVNGHIAANVPCDEENTSTVNVLIGQAPNLAPAELEFVEPLSSPGELCLYHADIASNNATTITDIAIGNNLTDDIDFPATSTVVLGVNEIAPLGDDHHAE